MSKSTVVVLACCVFTVGCDDRDRVLVTRPGGVPLAPAPVPVPPQPRPFPPVEFTEIAVGDKVAGVVPTSPEGCVGNPEWPCLYFHVTPPTDGTLVVDLNYRPETQPMGRFGLQTVDVSIVDELGGEAWAQFSTPTTTSARARVKAGVVYRIILWYAYPDLEYALETRLE
jgi:hypothetical protein